MKLYVLDTDISGFVQQEHPTVTARINALSDEDTIATTMITFGEDLSGWLPACRRAPDGISRARAYARLQGDWIFTATCSACPLMKQPPQSLISCAHKTNESEPTTSPSPLSHFQLTAFWLRAILWISSASLA